MLARVLIIEENFETREVLRYSLERAGFYVQAVKSQWMGEERMSGRGTLPDVLIVGVASIEKSPTNFVRALRDDPLTENISVIMTGSESDEKTRISVLNKGADEFLRLPMNPREVIARIRALLKRRVPEYCGIPIEFDGLRLDPADKSATFNGQPFRITRLEFNVLFYLASYPWIALKREQILDRVWRDKRFYEPRLVDVHVMRLRLRLGVEAEYLLETINGIGYRFSPRNLSFVSGAKHTGSSNFSNTKNGAMHVESAAQKILVIEKVSKIGQKIQLMLGQTGFRIGLCSSAKDVGDMALQERPDLLLVDLSLQRLSGPAFLSKVRRDINLCKVPIMFISSDDRESNRIINIESGADDHISDSIGQLELVARIKAVLRRAASQKTRELLEFNGLSLDPVSHTVALEGGVLHTSPKEFQLLQYLITTPGRVFSRQQILNGIWGADGQVSERIVDAQIRRLRMVLGRRAGIIRTVRGVGYGAVA